MGNIITPVLPHDLPESWTDNQYVTPGGVEVGLSEQHGFNYLMKQVNNTQKAVNELDSVAMSINGGKMLNSITFDASDYVGGSWARGILWTEDEALKGGVGGHGEAGMVQRLFFGMGASPWAPDTGIMVEPGGTTVKGVLYVDDIVVTKVATAVVG